MHTVIGGIGTGLYRRASSTFFLDEPPRFVFVAFLAVLQAYFVFLSGKTGEVVVLLYVFSGEVFILLQSKAILFIAVPLVRTVSE